MDQDRLEIKSQKREKKDTHTNTKLTPTRTKQKATKKCGGDKKY